MLHKILFGLTIVLALTLTFVTAKFAVGKLASNPDAVPAAAEWSWKLYEFPQGGTYAITMSPEAGSSNLYIREADMKNARDYQLPKSYVLTTGETYLRLNSDSLIYNDGLLLELKPNSTVRLQYPTDAQPEIAIENLT